jgi:hypothetical protein
VRFRCPALAWPRRPYRSTVTYLARSCRGAARRDFVLPAPLISGRAAVLAQYWVDLVVGEDEVCQWTPSLPIAFGPGDDRLHHAGRKVRRLLIAAGVGRLVQD